MSRFIFFAHGCLIVPAPLVVKQSFLCWITLAPLSKKLGWACLCGLISEFSILFHQYRCLNLWQYHTVLITVAVWWVLNLGRLISPTLVFFLKIVLAILVPLLFHLYFRKIFVFMKNFAGIFIGIVLKLYVTLG